MPATAAKPARVKTKLEQITAFLAQRRFALVGVSRHAQDFTRVVMRELTQRGYHVVPVTPNLDEAEGRQCVARVQDIEPRVEAAMLFTSPEITEQVLRDCAASGIRQVWIRLSLDRLRPEASAFARDHGINVIAGECPLMFLPGSAWFHQLHAFGRKLTGRYPR